MEIMKETREATIRELAEKQVDENLDLVKMLNTLGELGVLTGPPPRHATQCNATSRHAPAALVPIPLHLVRSTFLLMPTRAPPSLPPSFPRLRRRPRCRIHYPRQAACGEGRTRADRAEL